MTKNRFLQHVQKTEQINWVWFGIPHAAKRKLFPKCYFFLKNPQKVIKNNIFNQKVRNLHFLCHLIWPRWFNFLVHDLSAYIWLDFALVFHMLFVYSRKKKQWQKSEKKNKKSYLPTYPIFLEHVTPGAIPRHISILSN